MPLQVAPARNLATVTKSRPQWGGNTPRWLLRLLPWVDVDGGVFRVNVVEEAPKVALDPALGNTRPQTYAEYEQKPKEIHLGSSETVMEVFTKVEDIYSEPYDQVQEQLRVTLLALKEEQEEMILTNKNFGLLHSVSPQMRVSAANTVLGPDAMDSLLFRVWKWPAFFLAHPRALEGFCRSCTAKGLTLETVEMFGVPFITWRGVPIVPSDKLPIQEGKSSVLLMRVGQDVQGVIGLHQDDIGDPQLPSVVVRFMGMSAEGVASYLVTNYFATAVLSPDALGVLENVTV